jgi:hypothetical protein
MATRIRLYRGDVLPQLLMSFKDRDTGAPIDLSASTTVVTMAFALSGTTAALFTLTGVKQTGELLFDNTVDTTVSPAGAGGRVLFTFRTGDLDLDPAYYVGEFSIDYNGSVETVPDQLKFSLKEPL